MPRGLAAACVATAVGLPAAPVHAQTGGTAPDGEAPGATQPGQTGPSTGEPAPAARSRPSSRPIRLDRRTIRRLQRKLRVRADGRIGPRTRRAIRRAERRHRLRVDGRPDTRLLARLRIRLPAERGTEDDSAARTPRSVQPGAPAGDVARAAVAAAQAEIGKPYASGGNGPDAYDCSGLTVHAFKQAGVRLPRTSFDQYREGVRVAKADIQAGDLVFFDSNGAGASHVGVATSATTVISTTTSGVKEHAIDRGYWAEHYVGARRVG